MSKATAIAHPNVAFVKYWGRKDEALRLPTNGSLSMNLSACITKTTVEFSKDFAKDEVIINQENKFDQDERVIKHIDRIRALAGINLKAKVQSENNFPMSTGLSSSSSGFAALTVAGAAAAGLKLDEKKLSILARQGSGSACRSIPGGFVEWLDGNSSETSIAQTFLPASHWNLVDVVAVVSTEKKAVSTSEGQKYARTSPFFNERLSHMQERVTDAKKFIEVRDFKNFGELIEGEALELHAIMITSKPALIYWSEGTLKLMKLVSSWRAEGLPVYFTINTGQDTHLICEQEYAAAVEAKLKNLDFVNQVIINKPAEGAGLVASHLF